MSAAESASALLRSDESFALGLDAADPLAGYRNRFLIPERGDGSPALYFCGNSLGLQAKSVRQAVEQELDDWARLAVDAHFEGRTPWYAYHEVFRESFARLVGALPGEVVAMNGLTVNLHLLMVSFYRPTRTRFKVLMEDTAFPSDTYAVRTQIRYHGFDPGEALLIARPREGEHTLRLEDVEALIEREASSLALVLFGGVNYFTGQVFDLERIARAARARGCAVGFDLAHAAGNVPLRLHDWGADFAAWCTYKYLNGGPGAVAGCFVHRRHHHDTALPRFGGWWGNDPSTRFRMHLNTEFIPVASAEAWQLSNPPILAMVALKASLAIFDEVGMTALREKSLKLTGYLQYLIDEANPSPPPSHGEACPPPPPSRESDGSDSPPSQGGAGGGCSRGSTHSTPPARIRYEVITPRDPHARGCQLSILVHHRPTELLHNLHAEGIVCDFRPPNVIRVAPVPLYNTFHEVWRFAQVLKRHTTGEGAAGADAEV